MTNTELRRFLASRSACQPAMDWLGDRDSDQMWAECDRPDWLLWWAGHTVARQDLVLAACDCAELALRFMPEDEDRPRLAIETARRWARGEATVEEVGTAADAAYAAADAACAAADAACAAARAARAARAAYAAWAADAACAAANSFACAATAAAMCQVIRSRWPKCPLPGVTA